VKLSDVGEFGLIERLTDNCVVNALHVVKGIGDDCSVTRGAGDTLRLVTTDMLIERVHFLRDAITPRQLGAKALAVNLSDIAAMGGTALDAYVSIAVPTDLTVAYLDELYLGMKQLARRFAVNILGGDTTASKTDLVINIAVTGEVPSSQILYRHTAKAGDRIYVTGCLGDSGAGLHAILNGGTEGVESLVRRHLEPEPHLSRGRWLAQSGQARAMLDVSDGLTSDLGHICGQSHVGCTVVSSRLPLSPELVAYCDNNGLDALDFALSGGEDYVLLVTGSEELSKEPDLFEVGRVTESLDRILIGTTGEARELLASGWDHMRDDR